MPLRRSYDGQRCSIAATLEIVGERWTLLIVRNAFLGLTRFDEFQANLGIARNVLQTRLERLVDAGVFEKQLYQQRPKRYEYRLTDKGLDLWPTIVALLQWGDAHARPPEGVPVVLEHRHCGGAVDAHRICEQCGARLGARDVGGRAGPGAGPDHPLRRREELAAARAS